MEISSAPGASPHASPSASPPRPSPFAQCAVVDCPRPLLTTPRAKSTRTAPTCSLDILVYIYVLHYCLLHAHSHAGAPSRRRLELHPMLHPLLHPIVLHPLFPPYSLKFLPLRTPPPLPHDSPFPTYLSPTLSHQQVVRGIYPSQSRDRASRSLEG